MASNFDFLKSQFPHLFEPATHAERLIHTAPRASCFYARFTLEQAIHLRRRSFAVTSVTLLSHGGCGAF